MGADIIQISNETRLLRTWWRAKQDAGHESFTYAEAAEHVGVNPRDIRFRHRLRGVAAWIERQTNAVWVVQPDIGYRRAKPEEAADLVRSRRHSARRGLRKTIRSAVRMTEGVALPEDVQNRVLVELTATAAAADALADKSLTRLESHVHRSKRDLPTPETLRILAEGMSGGAQ